MAPLDIVPGVSGLTKFSSTIRLAGVSDNIGKLGLSSSVKGGIQQGASRISNLVETASKFGTERLRRAEAAFQNGANMVKNKLIKDTIEAAQLADKVVTGAKNLNPFRIKFVEDAMGNKVLVHDSAVNTHTIENGVRILFNTSDGVKVGSGGTKGTGDVGKGASEAADDLSSVYSRNYPNVELDEVIASGKNGAGELKKRWIVPNGYESVEHFLKNVDDTTIKEFGYDSIEEFKQVVGHVDEYLNASPKNNILNKGLARGTHMKGVDYDVLGFPIFKGDDLKFTTKLDDTLLISKDDDQFKACTQALKEAIEKGEIPKELFTKKQLAQIDMGLPRISDLTWHHHQVTRKMQLVVKETHNAVNHLGGNKLWGGGVR